MAKVLLPVTAEQALGTFGLLLMLLVAKLANSAYPAQPTLPQRACGLLARRAIDGIAVIGWLADRLPEYAAPGARAPAVAGNHPV